MVVGPDCCLLRNVECGARFESPDTVGPPKFNSLTILPEDRTLVIIIIGQTRCSVVVSSPIISTTSLRQPSPAALLSVPCYDKDDADPDTSLHSKKMLPLSLSQSPKYALLVPSLYAH